jgi:hypothetical protein
MPKLSGIPANRVAAIATWLMAFAAFVLGVVQVLPSGWQNYALIGSGLLVKVATTIKFLDGSQKWDALSFQQGIQQIEQPITKGEPIQTMPPMPPAALETAVQSVQRPILYDQEEELETGPPENAYDALDSAEWLENRAPEPAAPAGPPEVAVPIAGQAVPGAKPKSGARK